MLIYVWNRKRKSITNENWRFVYILTQRHNAWELAANLTPQQAEICYEKLKPLNGDKRHGQETNLQVIQVSNAFKAFFSV